ncbi:ATP-dependent DNA helicase PIF1-like [Papaver somniferum]|uniref:ATP-dependent DNA helicase PIF1-like n=1 Tax=Papaver somniferum TaxID=3469 RepID=UPI000E705314|nr:ATP-dependent DNA helicase PIF1-like [Papaver somniferum]
MQKDFGDIKLLVIDEYSMIGRTMFAKINLRCKDVFANSEPFGNVSIVLIGDIRQLPPVFDTPLYVQGGKNQLQLLGSVSYSLFDHCVRLETIFRQSGDEESAFRDALLRLSDGTYTYTDWELFNTRDLSVLTHVEQNKFKDVLHLFSTKSGALTYNHIRLKELGKPVARITSKNNCDTATRATSDEAKGLQNIPLLSKGARVMLRKNLLTKYGLVNGSRGVVVDIVYAEGKKSPEDMPIAVMVDFDMYTGPKFRERSNIYSNNSANNKLDICIRSDMPANPVTHYFVLGNHGSQNLGIDT